MKIKYRLKSNLFIAHMIMIISGIKILLEVFYSQPIWRIFIIVFLVFELLFLIYGLFFLRIEINQSYIESKFYFISKKIYYKDNIEIEIKPLLKMLRKKLVIKSKYKKIILWDFYSESLEQIKQYIESNL